MDQEILAISYGWTAWTQGDCSLAPFNYHIIKELRFLC